MITDLTKEQEDMIHKFRQKWLDIGLSTQPIDRKNTVNIVKKLYKASGQKEPTVLVFDSPHECLAAISLYNMNHSLKELTADFIKNNIKDMSEIEPQSLLLGGGLDAYWLAFYEFGRIIGVKYNNTEHFDAYIDYAKNCGIMYAYEDVAFVSDRPEIINMEDGVLHCENGPSIRFRDGFEVYTWRGNRIPADWINDKSTITPEVCFSWENMDQRRSACDIVGWHTIMDQMNAILINKDDNPQIGELWDIDIPDIGRTRLLKVQCGTGRTFSFLTDESFNTALEANADTYGVDPDIYKLMEIRT